MSNTAQINKQFAIQDQLSFHEHDSGLVIAEINNAFGQASICLQGAHLMSWQPKHESVPVVWLSKDAKVLAGKSIRGGAPICWPWFGAHSSDNTLPGHGHARTVPWHVVETGSEPCGATRITLRLSNNDAHQKFWANPAIAEITIVIGQALRMELSTENTGSTSFTLTEALHTYFEISDIAKVNVSGLDQCTYWDKVGGSELKQQVGDVTFDSETDRVYINTPAKCVIHDAGLGREIHIAKANSLSTIVWTPWTEKANKMGDLGQADGWRNMLCIESANALDNGFELAAGQKHTLIVEYSTQKI